MLGPFNVSRAVWRKHRSRIVGVQLTVSSFCTANLESADVCNVADVQKVAIVTLRDDRFIAP